MFQNDCVRTTGKYRCSGRYFHTNTTFFLISPLRHIIFRSHSLFYIPCLISYRCDDRHLKLCISLSKCCCFYTIHSRYYILETISDCCSTNVHNDVARCDTKLRE